MTRTTLEDNHNNKVISVYTPYTSAIREIDGNDVVWVKGNLKRDIEEERCTLYEAYDRILNSDYYKSILRFTLEERVEDKNSPNGYRWDILYDFLDGDELMTPQAERKWDTLVKIFKEKEESNFSPDNELNEIIIDRIYRKLHHGHLVIRMKRFEVETRVNEVPEIWEYPKDF